MLWHARVLPARDGQEQTTKLRAPTLRMQDLAERHALANAAKRINEAIAGGQVVEVPTVSHASIRERPVLVLRQLRASSG